MAIWSQVAYACRYGKQPLSEVLAMTPATLEKFKTALAGIVALENK